MTQRIKSLLYLAASFILGLAAVSAQAGSSSASSAASDSVGSLSTSIQKSSTSSSTNNKVAQGQYKVIDMAEIAQQPNMMRVRLQALAAAPTQEFTLILPRKAAERGELAKGRIIEAQKRPFGLAFSVLDMNGIATPFFLVLDDAWFRELESRPVSLQSS